MPAFRRQRKEVGEIKARLGYSEAISKEMELWISGRELS